MNRSEVFDVDGAWWARSPDGTWVRWDSGEGRWVAQPAPPPSLWRRFTTRPAISPVTTPPPAAPGSQLGATRAPGTLEGLNPVDRWWNANFPAYSARRLVFLLAVIPIVMAGYAFYRSEIRGKPLPSWVYVFAAVASAVMVTFGWVIAVRQRRSDARPPGAPPSPKLTPAIASAAGEQEPRRLLLIAAGCFAFLLITELIYGLTETFTPEGLLVTAFAAGIMTVIWALRYTIAAPIVTSVAMGYPVGVILYLFTFWLGGTSLAENWIFASVCVFMFALPAWVFFMRLSGRSVGVLDGLFPQHRRLQPQLLKSFGWVFIVMTVVLMWSAGLYARFADGSLPGEASDVGVVPNIGAGGGSEITGASSQDAAARALFDAWMSGSQGDASGVASSDAIGLLFGVAPTDEAQLGTCRVVAGGSVGCPITVGDTVVMLAPEQNPQGPGTFYIVSAESATTSDSGRRSPVATPAS